MPDPKKNRNSPAACTIITRCYLSHARILAESYLRHEPTGRFYLVVVDGLPDGVDAGVDVRMVTPEELELPYLNELFFKYDLVEFCTSIKPTLLAMLMNRLGEERVLYIDPDIMIARPMDELMRALDTSSIVLTPHLLRPHELDGQHPSDQDILMAGAYNLGFIGLRKTTQTADFLRWWEGRLREYCRNDPKSGLMTDQKWIDLVPGLFSETTILRDESYNVAYWNSNARRIIRCGREFLVNARPLSFFHFSNFDPENPLSFSRDHGRGAVVRGTGLGDLLELYAQLQIEKGYRTSTHWKYQRAAFDNGVIINRLVRLLYLGLSPARRERFGDPFETAGENSFFNWAVRPTSDHGGMSPFVSELYNDRIDLQGAFPDITGADLERFLDWTRNSGPQEMGYDPRLATFDTEADQRSPVAEPLEYGVLVDRLRQLIRSTLPTEAIISVISKGDPELLDHDDRTAWHFPRTPDGRYAGSYPANGTAALAHLQAEIDEGVQFFVVPQTSQWWLVHYAELGSYLATTAKLIVEEPDVCRIYAVGQSMTQELPSPDEQITRLLQSRSHQVAEIIAENLKLRNQLAELQALSRGVMHDSGIRVAWGMPALNGDRIKSEPAKLLLTGDIRWLAHESTGRLVSIILPVRIHVEELRGLLDKIGTQKSRDPTEVIGFIVDTETEKMSVFEEFGATVIGLAGGDPRVLNQNLARNLGSSHARGKIFIFLGENIVPGDHDWLARLVMPMDRNPAMAGVCGKIQGQDHPTFHTESTAIRADVFRSCPFTSLSLVDGRFWEKTVVKTGFTTAVEVQSLAISKAPSASLEMEFRKRFTDGILRHDMPGELTDVAASRAVEDGGAEIDPVQLKAAAAVFGEWLGKYLSFSQANYSGHEGGV